MPSTSQQLQVSRSKSAEKLLNLFHGPSSMDGLFYLRLPWNLWNSEYSISRSAMLEISNRYGYSFIMPRSYSKIKFTSFVKYPEVILWIAGETHIWRYVTNRQIQRHPEESRRCKGYFWTTPKKALRYISRPCCGLLFQLQQITIILTISLAKINLSIPSVFALEDTFISY